MQNTTQTVIGGELETTPAFINVAADWRCRVNKMTALLMLGRFIVRHFVGNFMLVWQMGLRLSQVIWKPHQNRVFIMRKDILFTSHMWTLSWPLTVNNVRDHSSCPVRNSHFAGETFNCVVRIFKYNIIQSSINTFYAA